MTSYIHFATTKSRLLRNRFPSQQRKLDSHKKDITYVEAKSRQSVWEYFVFLRKLDPDFSFKWGDVSYRYSLLQKSDLRMRGRGHRIALDVRIFAGSLAAGSTYM